MLGLHRLLLSRLWFHLQNRREPRLLFHRLRVLLSQSMVFIFRTVQLPEAPNVRQDVQRVRVQVPIQQNKIGLFPRRRLPENFLPKLL